MSATRIYTNYLRGDFAFLVGGHPDAHGNASADGSHAGAVVGTPDDGMLDGGTLDKTTLDNDALDDDTLDDGTLVGGTLVGGTLDGRTLDDAAHLAARARAMRNTTHGAAALPMLLVLDLNDTRAQPLPRQLPPPPTAAVERWTVWGVEPRRACKSIEHATVLISSSTTALRFVGTLPSHSRFFWHANRFAVAGHGSAILFGASALYSVDPDGAARGSPTCYPPAGACLTLSASLAVGALYLLAGFFVFTPARRRWIANAAGTANGN